MRSWLKSPALHFLLIGGFLFAAGSWRTSSCGLGTAADSIVLSVAEIQRLRRSWLTQTGRLPDGPEDRALIDRAIDEELLFHEALARGLDRQDEVVQRRLVELAKFVSDEPGADEQALVREARRLGLDRSDLVVRRRLIETMRLIARQPAAPEAVTDADLQGILEREPERYRTPPKVTLTHVYLSGSRRGRAVETDARSVLEKLRSRHVPSDEAPAMGDPFPLTFHLTEASDRDLEKSFGTGFAAAVAGVNPGEWAGPISSSYGVHLVWVHERLPARLPSLESVRTQLLHRLREERAEERLRTNLQKLRSKYVIRIDDAGDPRLTEVAGSRPAAEVELPRPAPFLGD